MLFHKSKTFFKLGFFSFLTVLVAVISCSPKDNNNNTARVLTNEPIETSKEDTDKDSYSRTECSQEEAYSDELSIENLKFVDSNNVGKFLLQGRCKAKNELIYVTVNGYKTSNNPKCDKSRWKVTLDLTPVATEESSVIFHLSHNQDSLCKKVRVSFLGPRNYIPISSVDDHYESSFYVMKYEAKVEGQGSSAKAVSVPAGQPASRISYKEALTLCQNNGSRYDLIQNLQWQNIALAIEEINENWSQGHSLPSDSNTLNCGLFKGNPREASSNDSQDCAVTFCDSGWDQNRRTHLLPSGRIWDICGNVGEIMKDKYRKDNSFDDYVYQLSSQLKQLFGPKKTYKIVNANRRSNTWNLGYAKIKKGYDLIVRGLPGREAGIFSVDITSDQASRRSYSGDIGFRCVYTP